MDDKLKIINKTKGIKKSYLVNDFTSLNFTGTFDLFL
jgi:hypothetical protein